MGKLVLSAWIERSWLGSPRRSHTVFWLAFGFCALEYFAIYFFVCFVECVHFDSDHLSTLFGFAFSNAIDTVCFVCAFFICCIWLGRCFILVVQNENEKKGRTKRKRKLKNLIEKLVPLSGKHYLSRLFNFSACTPFDRWKSSIFCSAGSTWNEHNFSIIVRGVWSNRLRAFVYLCILGFMFCFVYLQLTCICITVWRTIGHAHTTNQRKLRMQIFFVRCESMWLYRKLRLQLQICNRFIWCAILFRNE